MVEAWEAQDSEDAVAVLEEGNELAHGVLKVVQKICLFRGGPGGPPGRGGPMMRGRGGPRGAPRGRFPPGDGAQGMYHFGVHFYCVLIPEFQV